MNLADEYRQQFGWRPWQTIFDELPYLSGQTVLDLGCGVGDQAVELIARDVRVIGVDMNEELLRAARVRQLGNAEFRLAAKATTSKDSGYRSTRPRALCPMEPVEPRIASFCMR